MGTGSFRGVISGRGVTLTTHPFLLPWSWKSRAIPLLPLWAVRPVQSFSACTKVTFTLLYLPLHPEEDSPTEKVTHRDQKVTDFDGSSKKFVGKLSNYTASHPHFYYDNYVQHFGTTRLIELQPKKNSINWTLFRVARRCITSVAAARQYSFAASLLGNNYFVLKWKRIWKCLFLIPS
jgi:hypothetical protein